MSMFLLFLLTHKSHFLPPAALIIFFFKIFILSPCLPMSIHAEEIWVEMVDEISPFPQEIRKQNLAMTINTIENVSILQQQTST